MDRTDDRLFTAKDVMKLCDVSRKQLFYYEKKGLLKNVTRNDENNYRLYTRDHIEMIFIILEYLGMGYDLERISNILDNESVEDIRVHVSNWFEDAAKEYQESIKKYEQSNKKYLQFMEGLLRLEVNERSEGIDAERVGYYIIPGQTVVEVESVGTPLDIVEVSQIGLSPLYSLLKKRKYRANGPLRYYFSDIVEKDASAYRRGEKPLKRAMPVAPSGGEDEVYKDSVKCASVIHIGDYDEKIIDSYVKILDWCKERGIRLTGDSIEEYLIGTELTRNKNLYVTRISLPIDE